MAIYALKILETSYRWLRCNRRDHKACTLLKYQKANYPADPARKSQSENRYSTKELHLPFLYYSQEGKISFKKTLLLPMDIISHSLGEKKFAEVLAEITLINSAEDALDLMGNIYYQGFDALILHSRNITPDFFDLKNGLAGEILQKFSNYRIRLAIVGDFRSLQGKSIRDFMYESNMGRHVSFVPTVDQALAALAK